MEDYKQNIDGMRLQKFLSAAGVCSRRKGEEMIKSGAVSVNGVPVTELGTRVDPQADRVEVKGKRARIREERIYLALNKPEGYITSCDHGGRKIVTDLIDLPGRVYPVGRLDKDSKGLILLTNDGRLHHRLSHPSFDHEKEYEVTVSQVITDGALKKMSKGMQLKEGRTRPCKTTRLSPTKFKITLKEGKNRQIRRMVQKVGNEVVTLNRLRIKNIRLGTLPVGKWRHLTEKEKKELFKGL